VLVGVIDGATECPAADLIFNSNPARQWAAVQRPAPVASPETAFQAVLGYLGWPVTIVAIVLVTVMLIMMAGAVLHVLDHALDRSSQDSWPDAYLNVGSPAVEAPSSSIDPYNFLQSELSAADFREQTKLLCALRDKLDADAEAARATIRRERALAQQTERNTP